ncbi:MAG: ribonuclease M5 [Desulfobacteraceae bacterium]|nr:ribonuclease M5 [Desulfobacteraceae bacterium]
MQVKEIIVVEGRDDVSAVKAAVAAEFIVTNGYGIGEDTFERIEFAVQRRGVIVFTDPDHAGEMIRKRIARRIPGCRHAYLTQPEALKKGDIGIENAAPDVIRAALARACTILETDTVSDITGADLERHRLIGYPGAARRRELLGRHLKIGYANGKQLPGRLHGFGITGIELDSAMGQVNLDFTP